MRARHSLIVLSLAILAAAGVARAVAHDATPAAAPLTVTLVEHADHVVTVDLGETGSSPGDLITWGPDPLYDAANAIETGATTQGVCVVFAADGACMADETIVFADGGTLEIHGVQAGGSRASSRTIVGGSGKYRGVTGTVRVVPAGDLSVFTKDLELSFP